MPQELKHAQLRWVGALEFEGSTPEGATMTIDAEGKTGPGPMPALLLTAAACATTDVVLMLEKMRVKLASLTVDATGTRREEEPRRYVAVQLIYRLRGEGLDETKARRAVELSIEKYCSVIHSLAPDIRVGFDVEIA
jgi:putative redox protein